MIFENTQNVRGDLDNDSGVSAEKLKSYEQIFFQFGFLELGTFERDTKLTPKDLFRSKLSRRNKTRREETQYEFMDIHWLFDEQKSTPYHHENVRRIQETRWKSCNLLVRCFVVR